MKSGFFVLFQPSLSEFPGGPVIKNMPSNAGDVGLSPGQGTKVSYARGQLSLI